MGGIYKFLGLDQYNSTIYLVLYIYLLLAEDNNYGNVLLYQPIMK